MNEFALHAVFAVGGGLGAVARHGLTCLVPHRFPVATLIVNVVGSLLLGSAVALLARDEWSVVEEGRRLVFGFCGGFTTFSSFAWRSLELYREHTLLHAAANVVVNLGLCLFAFGAGRMLV